MSILVFIATLFTIAKRWKNTSVYQWMSRQNEVYIHNGILFSLNPEAMYVTIHISVHRITSFMKIDRSIAVTWGWGTML